MRGVVIGMYNNPTTKAAAVGLLAQTGATLTTVATKPLPYVAFGDAAGSLGNWSSYYDSPKYHFSLVILSGDSSATPTLSSSMPR